MTKRRTLLLMLIALLCATGAHAGDFEYSPRHLALAGTGNAIFNPAIRFCAAIRAMFPRAVTLALAICGAMTRFSSDNSG